MVLFGFHFLDTTGGDVRTALSLDDQLLVSAKHQAPGGNILACVTEDKFGGEFHRVRLWEGRLWPWSQDQGETGFGEARIQQQSYLWLALRGYGRIAMQSV